MPTQNRFKLGSALGGHVAGLQDAAELALIRNQATEASFDAAIKAEQRELLKGQRREWENYEEFREAGKRAELDQARAMARGSEWDALSKAYKFSEDVRTQDLRDRQQLAGIERTETATDINRYNLSEAREGRDIRDLQKRANLEQTMASTQASVISSQQRTAEFQSYVEDTKRRAAERRLAIKTAEAQEKSVGKAMQLELEKKELSNRAEIAKLSVLEDDASLEREAKDLAVLRARNTQGAFEEYKRVTKDGFIGRYNTLEEAKPYLNRKSQSVLLDTKTRRQLLLYAAQKTGGKAEVEGVYNDIMKEIFRDGIEVLDKDPNKRWFMTLYMAGRGVMGDPINMYLMRMMQGYGASGVKEPGTAEPTPTGGPVAPPPSELSIREVNLISQDPAFIAEYDKQYGVGAFEKAKARFFYDETKDEPLGLKQ